MRYTAILSMAVIAAMQACDPASRVNEEIGAMIEKKQFAEAARRISEEKQAVVDPVHVLKTAQFFSERTDYEKSTPLLEKLVETDTVNVLGRLLLGNNYRQQKKYNEALKIYDELAAIDSIRFIVLPERARVYIHLEETEKAAQDIAEAKGLQPKYFASFLADGLLQFSQGRRQEALDLFEIAENLDPGVSAEASLYAGYILLAGKVNYDALGKFTRAIENGKNINKGYAFINRGICQINLTDTNFACEDWDSAMTYLPGEAEKYLSLYCRK